MSGKTMLMAGVLLFFPVAAPALGAQESCVQMEQVAGHLLECDVTDLGGTNITARAFLLNMGGEEPFFNSLLLYDLFLQSFEHTTGPLRDVVSDPPGGAVFLEAQWEDPIPNADGSRDIWVVKTPRRWFWIKAHNRWEIEPYVLWGARHERAAMDVYNYINHPARISGMM